MGPADVLAIYALLEANAIFIWLDGGWGVDALLDRQTREHGDVDIIVQSKDVQQMHEVLARQGFRVTDSEKWWNFVMADDQGRAIDVHVITLDDMGNGCYGPQDDPVILYEPYPASALTATGLINGAIVRCVSADFQVISHTGYALDEHDFNDVAALHERFGIALPAEYRRDTGLTPQPPLHLR